MRSSISRLASLAAGVMTAYALVVSGEVAAGLSSEAHAQASVLLKHQMTTAIVESVDSQHREILLHDANGNLVTVEYGSAIRDLPHLSAGDKLSLSFVETLGAQMAAPGSPLPESTVQTARGYVKGHPRGVIASFRRERAKIVSIDLKTHTVSFDTEDGANHVVVLRTKAMQDFLKTLKVGDSVDITRMESISYVIKGQVTAPAPASAAPAPAHNVK